MTTGSNGGVHSEPTQPSGRTVAKTALVTSKLGGLRGADTVFDFSKRTWAARHGADYIELVDWDTLILPRCPNLFTRLKRSVAVTWDGGGHDRPDPRRQIAPFPEIDGRVAVAPVPFKTHAARWRRGWPVSNRFSAFVVHYCGLGNDARLPLAERVWVDHENGRRPLMFDDLKRFLGWQ